MLWKLYIDFEIALAEVQRAVLLYERLLERTQHVKVFISFANFLAESERTNEARDCFVRAETHMKDAGLKEERVAVLDALLAFEKALPAGEGDVAAVEKRMPKRVRKRRPVNADDAAAGIATEWEEYYDFVFPEDSAGIKGLAILEMARKWKEAQEAAAAATAAAGGDADAAGSSSSSVKRKAAEEEEEEGAGGDAKRSRTDEETPAAGAAVAAAAEDQCEIDIDDL